MATNPGDHKSDEARNEEQSGDVPADTFAIRLVMVRHHAGRLSIEQAAKLCELNSGNWANWEDGRQPRDRVEVAQRIADSLGVSFNWLLLGGPLIPARGKPTKRANQVTARKPSSPVRPRDTRSKVRVDSRSSNPQQGSGRRAIPIR